MAPENKKRKPAAPSAVVRPPQQPTAAITPPPLGPQPHGGSTWFDMFAPAPAIPQPQTPQIPQVGGGAAAPQPAVDPFTAFLMSQAGQQQQQPMIPPFDIVGAINAMRSEGPVAEHNKLASLPSYAPGSQSPFAMGYFQGPQLTPEARLASQGNTAANQWGQLGVPSSINPEELRRLNMQRRLY